MEEQTFIQENSGIVADAVHVEGENIAMGDFHQHQYIDSNPSFSSIQFDDSDYPAPTFMESVLQLLKAQRIIIIKGNNHFDHVSFGKQLAQKIILEQEQFGAIELIQNEENKPLLNQLNQQKREQVVILDGLHPRHIQYGLNQLINLCEQKSSYYIIHTETSFDTWQKASEMLSNYWYSIPEDDHYKHDDLCGWFLKQIIKNPISFFNEEDELTRQSLLSENYTIDKVIGEIGTPDKLTLFLNICRQNNTVFSDSKLDQIVNQLHQEQVQIVARWFNNLKPQEKIIALTVALFNGVYASQYFEILDTMMATTLWKEQQQTLAGLDYHSLDFLQSFFRYETAEQGDMIVARNQTTRVHLLKTAIGQYPRHIEAALLAFSDIMENSYRKAALNWDLYGTTQKRALLRQVFIEATRDIGINQLSNIEGVFLKLAASDHKHIQGVAAKSLAQYRLLGHDDLLFDTVKEWQADQTIQDRMTLFLKDKMQSKQKAIVAIKSTTVRALAYAADYDQPNQLHERIVADLIVFAKESDTDIQYAVASALPKFIQHHSQQLQNHIFDDLMPVGAYSSAISEGLGKAYEHYPDTLKPVINHWISICKQTNSEENRRHKTTYRDNRLVTILELLQNVELQADKGFNLQELYTLSIELLQTEKRGGVVESIIQLIASIQTRDYSLAYTNIPETLQNLSRRQRKIVLNTWVRQFLVERSLLQGREFTITINNKDYPAWDKMVKRPLTAIEEALFVWLNSNSKTAQKYATLAFLEFAKWFEAEEYDLIQEHKARETEREARRIAQKQAVKIPTIAQGVPELGLGIWLRLKIFFYLLFENSANKHSLKRIIKVFQTGPYSKRHLRLVTYKWRTRAEGDFSSKLAKWLDRLIHHIKS